MGHRYDTATHSREGEGGGGDSRDKNPAFHASVSLGQMSGCGRLVWEWGGGSRKPGREPIQGKLLRRSTQFFQNILQLMNMPQNCLRG